MHREQEKAKVEETATFFSLCGGAVALSKAETFG